MPIIGQTFTPQTLSLLLQKLEGNKDRNLRASIADRQFQDSAKERLLRQAMSREALSAQGRGRGGGGRTFEQNLADLERAKKYAAEAAKTSGTTDPQIAKILADAALKAAQGKAVKDTTAPKVELIGAQTADEKASAAKRAAETQTENEMRGPKVAASLQMAEESKARVRGYESRIKDAGARAKFREVNAAWENMRAGKKDVAQVFGLATKLIELQARHDSRFGELVINPNGEAARMINGMLNTLFSSLPAHLKKQVGTHIQAKQHEMLRLGGVLSSDAPNNNAPAQVQELLKALRAGAPTPGK